MSETVRTPYPLVLASRSPRRAELLAEAGYTFEVGPFPDVDETPSLDLGARGAVLALARKKADAVRHEAVDKLVLTADTLVSFGGELLGKPVDTTEAVRMLTRLSGRAHQVATAVGLAGPDGERGVRIETLSAVTTVRFRPLDAAEIEAYVATGEPLDKAGAYAIQGGAEGFVESIDGAKDNVIGLPLDVVRRLVARFSRG
ncbi:MAG: Maf family protein [Planctomycetota bacterium]|nr:Maf family protein [Planctomycetota bacterium]